SVRFQPTTWNRLGGGSDTIAPLVLRVGLRGPWQQLIARVDGGLQASFELAKWLAELRLQRRDAIPTKHEFGRVMQQFAQALLSGQRTFALADGEDGQAVLGDGQGMTPLGGAAPTHGAGKARGEVVVGPGLRIGIEEIEPASRLQKHESAGVSTQRSGGRGEHGHGRAPLVSDWARRVQRDNYGGRLATIRLAKSGSRRVAVCKILHSCR